MLEPPCLKAIDFDEFPIVYHYCSTQSFLSIIQSKTLWLSDVNTLNDYSETHWAYEQFIEALNLEINENNITIEFCKQIDEVVSTSQLRILPFVCSFSTNGDLLSQWRAYADDGCGFAIGFNSQEIHKLSVLPILIEYQKSNQINYFRNYIRFIYQSSQNIAHAKRRSFLFENASYLAVDLCGFKKSGFLEESEFRIVRAMGVHSKSGQHLISDSGGTGPDKISRKKLPVQFRSRNGAIVSYISLPLHGLANNFISSITIGPKNPTNFPEISTLLKNCGLAPAIVRKSETSYR